MISNHMRFMHNSHSGHASRETEKLRQADLNLLITFAAIAEEKSITAAASQLLLSQPAVSRALQRARTMFQDDLLNESGT
jgi:LysR family transcriptional activator of mexEF-oprN operon